jgi:ferredoxin
MSHRSLWTLSRTVAIIALVAVPAVGEPSRGGPKTALTTFETADFSGSGVCANCHTGLVDDALTEVSPDRDWRSTMMANAAKDPLWQAKLSSEIDRNPHVASVIEDKCSRCHTPMARVQAVADGTPVGLLGTGFLDDENRLHEAAIDGVSCTLCHQVQPDGLGTPDSFTGGYVIDTSTDIPDRELFGPYPDPVDRTMHTRTGFLAGEGAQLTDSAHCATCHTLYTPVLDSAGNLVDAEFPEQTTWLEWRHSGYPVSCQDCHLPVTDGSVVISTRGGRLDERSPFGQHHFVGGNVAMVGVLAANARLLGVTADDEHFEATLSRTLEQLTKRTARVTVTPERSGGRLALTVDVVNLAGHKLPTGLPSRRAWLHVVVTDGDGGVVFESGRPLADGRIEGNDADEGDGTTWEPHWRTISSPDQVQLYEPVMRTVEGDVTWTLLHAFEYAKDNRLLPDGFDKGSAAADFAVVGDATADDDFTGGGDRVVYDLDLAGASGSVDVAVELLFQTLSYPFVSDLARTYTDLVRRFVDMTGGVADPPVVLASSTIRVD